MDFDTKTRDVLFAITYTVIHVFEILHKYPLFHNMQVQGVTHDR